MKANATQLLLKTAVESFWNGYYSIPDAYAGLRWERTTTQKTDTFARMGAAPMPEEWVGNRNAKDVNEYSYSVTNKWYDSTIRIDKDMQRYQQFDVVSRLAGNQGQKAAMHHVKLASALIEAGISTTGDDGQFFFDTDHADPGAPYTTSQNNDLTFASGTGTTPSDLEAAAGIRAMRSAFWGYKDDQGDPAVPNSDAAADFIVVVPPAYYSIFNQVLTASALTGPIGNDLQGTFTLRVDPFLTLATTFYMFYAGNDRKPIIVNQAGPLETTDSVDPLTGDVLFSATWSGRVTYGEWRSAIVNITS